MMRSDARLRVGDFIHARNDVNAAVWSLIYAFGANGIDRLAGSFADENI
jgi:hypothetical protein